MKSVLLLVGHRGFGLWIVGGTPHSVAAVRVPVHTMESQSPTASAA